VKARERLYPTVSEERERKAFIDKLKLTRTASSKGGGMSKSPEKTRDKERQKHN